MSPELKRLEEILKRNSAEPDTVNIDDEVSHYFFFDEIADAADLEEAWSAFPEQAEIRKRLALVESDSGVIPGWGYRVPADGASIDDDALLEMVRKNVLNLRPMLAHTDDNRELIEFIDRGFVVEIAPQSAHAPDAPDNDLFMSLYEAMQENRSDRFPHDAPHYRVLYNWAIYLTKCDEVACYLIWPCLSGNEAWPADTLEPFVRLWKLNCRDRFWIKQGDPSSGTIYVRPPWMDAA